MNVLRFCFNDFVIWTSANDIESSEQYLTNRQRQYAATQLSGNRKLDFIRSRALLNYIAGELLEFPSDPPEDTSGDGISDDTPLRTPTPSDRHGKFYVSLSHKRSLAAVVSSHQPNYGIDIEHLKASDSALRAKVLNTSERIRFSSEDLDTITAFSFKEAVFKAINRKFSDVRRFDQCEILEVNHGLIKANITSGSAQGLELSGYIFYLKNNQGNFVITVAKLK